MIGRGESEAGAEAGLRPLGEERASAAIEGSAAAASVVGLIYLATRAPVLHDERRLAAALIYGVSMSVALGASALYHAARRPRLKRFFQNLDHCTIFLFIAGTYTPIDVGALWLQGGGLLLGAIWALAGTGIALRLTKGPSFLSGAIPIYLGMGWLFLGWSGSLYRSAGAASLALIVAGGLSYSGGLLILRRDDLPYRNPLWHACVVIGSAFLYAAVARILQS